MRKSEQVDEVTLIEAAQILRVSYGVALRMALQGALDARRIAALARVPAIGRATPCGSQAGTRARPGPTGGWRSSPRPSGETPGGTTAKRGRAPDEAGRASRCGATEGAGLEPARAFRPAGFQDRCLTIRPALPRANLAPFQLVLESGWFLSVDGRANRLELS